MESPQDHEAPDTENSGAAAAVLADDMYHDREQLRLLLIGFGTGMTIAGIFLIYIVLEYSGLLP